jgi:hypothetical protein
MNVIWLYVDHRHDSTTVVAFFGLASARIKYIFSVSESLHILNHTLMVNIRSDAKTVMSTKY